MRKVITLSILALFTFIISQTALAQLTGTKTIGVDYATLASAITALNASGVGAGGVVFNVPAGYTETVPTGGYVINITTNLPTASNTVVFQKSGSGANPLISSLVAGSGSVAGSGLGGNGDAFIKLVGVSYITINGINITENYTGATTSLKMEYGIMLARASATQGCKNVIIKNCVITQQLSNLFSSGIFSTNLNAAGTTTNPTSIAGRHENIYVDGCTVANSFNGLYFVGYNDPSSPYLLYDNNYQIGVTTANTFTNLGSSGVTNAGNCYGIFLQYIDSAKVANNTLTLNTGTNSVTHYGLYFTNTVNAVTDITGNTVTLTSGGTSSQQSAIALNSLTGTAGAVNITGNTVKRCTYTTATTANAYYINIQTTGIPYTLNISNNTIDSNSIGGTGTATGTQVGIYVQAAGGNTNAGSTCTIASNTVSNTTRTQSAVAGGAFYGINMSSSCLSTNINGNNIRNNTLPSTGVFGGVYSTASTTYPNINIFSNNIYNNSRTNASGTGATYFIRAAGLTVNCYSNNVYSNTFVSGYTGSVYGYYNFGSPTTENIYNNSFHDITHSGASQIFPIYTNTSSTDVINIYSNSIYNISNNNNAIFVIYPLLGSTIRMYKNNIYNITSAGAAGSIYALCDPTSTAASNVYIYNNFVSQLNCTAATTYLSAAIYVTSATAHNAYVYYNTVYLDNISSVGTQMDGIYMNSAVTCDVRNNVIVNVSNSVSGSNVAVQRSSTTISTYSTNSNFNCYYLGGTSTAVYYFDGTNADYTFGAMQTRVAPRDGNSVSVLPPFINVSSAPYDLHINTGIATQLESGGTNLATFTTDYDGDTRNATTPDIGADEFIGTPYVLPKTLSSLTYNQASTAGTAQGQANQEILRLDFSVTGNSGTLPLNSIVVNSANVTDADVSAVKLYRTTTNTFSTANPLGSSTTFSGGTATFSGLSYDLPTGTTYIWAVYDISGSATIGNYVDAKINANQIDVNGSNYPAADQSPAGVRNIGTVFTFDGGTDNCFTHSLVTGTLDEWQRGTPTTVGPSAAYSTPYCWATNISANYSNSVNYALYTTGFKATGTSVNWSFYEWYRTEANYDYCYPEYRINGGAWTAAVAGYSGVGTSWALRSFNITTAVNDKIEFRYRFSSDVSGVFAGWYIDNMFVGGAAPNDVTAPALTYTALSNTASTSNVSFTGVSASDCENGINFTAGTAPRCFYKKTTHLNEFNDNTPGTNGWKYAEASGLSSPFDFTIDYSLFAEGSVVVGDTIQYFVVAQDNAGIPNVGINSGTFTGTPTDVNLTGNFPIGGTINKYIITSSPMSGTFTIGAALFNKLTGLDLQVKTLTRKVKRLVEEPAGDMLRKGETKNGQVSTSSSLTNGNSTAKMRYEEVEETYSELWTKDGKKYTGDLFVPSRKTGKGDDPLTAGDYATITAAVNDLNNRGVSGAVTFLLLDGSYPTETYPIQFNNNISGISATNNVTLKPNGGVTATIPGNVNSNATIRILSNYVTIDGSNSGGTDRSLTITNTGTTPTVILVGSTGTTPISNVMVKNCTITNGVNTSTAVIVSDATTLGNAGYFNTVTFQNNNITNAFNGIYVNTTTGNNLFMYDNLVNTSISGTGFYVQGVNGGTISGNNIGNITNATDATNVRNGIWLATGSLNITIEKNTIHDMSYTGINGYSSDGIKISNGGTASTGIVVKNNMIYNINSDGDAYATYGGAFSPVGIYCYGSAQTGISIFNNSIFLTGNTINYSAGSYSIGICLDDGSVADVRNNLIINNEGLLGSTGAGALCLAVETGASQLSACNNNDYYANPPAGVKGLVKVGSSGTDQLTMATVRNATTKDEQSFNRMPVFVSTTDLHIQPADLTVSGRGTYITSVNADYDGDARATSQSTVNRPVDVGADQYTPAGYTTGNLLTFSSPVYSDGGMNGIRITNGAFTTSGVYSFPGVRTPNNLSGKILVKRNVDATTDSKLSSQEQNRNSKDNSGTKDKNGKISNNNQNDGPLSVNVPWIYYTINDFVITTAPVTLRFFYNVDQLATISETNLEVAMWTGSSWEIVPGQSVNTTNHYIQLTFDDWLGVWPSPMTFALTDLTSPLPVELCAFDAAVSARNINLTWKTCSEVNNKGFNVERRVLVDPATNRYSDWTNVAFINGHGTTNEEHVYSYGETKMITGKYQYRLKQVDFNGHEEYFTLNSPNVVEIGKPVKADVSQNYPNPSNPKTKIDYQIPFDGKVSLKVYDIIGREITTMVDAVKEAGFYTAEFDGSALSSGVYFYRIVAEGSGGQKFTDTKKMILVK